MTTSTQALTQPPHRLRSRVNGCSVVARTGQFPRRAPVYPRAGHINTSSAATDHRAPGATVGAGRIGPSLYQAVLPIDLQGSPERAHLAKRGGCACDTLPAGTFKRAWRATVSTRPRLTSCLSNGCRRLQ